jgi:type IV pilus assembly protein PilW
MTPAHRPNQSCGTARGINVCPGPGSISHRQTGLSLVELLVSMVLGLFLIGGILNLFISNRESFRVNENLSRMQENGRAAFDVMSRSVREAGENACGTALVANVIRNASGTVPWWADWNAGTVRGFNGDQDTTDIAAFGTTNGSRVAGTDAILVIQAEQAERVVTNHSAATNEITMQSVDGIDADDVVIACDMNGAAIFQVGTVSASLRILDYTASMTDLNCGNALGYPTPAICTTAGAKVFMPGALVAKLSATFWYVGFNAKGQRTLFRSRISKVTVAGDTTVTPVREEMLTGVQDLQINYLTTNLSNSTLATAWIDANDSVFSVGNNAWADTNLNQAVAARFNLTLQSEENVSVDGQPIQRRLTHIVALRNRDALIQSAP